VSDAIIKEALSHQRPNFKAVKDSAHASAAPKQVTRKLGRAVALVGA
jgi:hypothetical protein